jgi:hypothetical protein
MQFMKVPDSSMQRCCLFTRRKKAGCSIVMAAALRYHKYKHPLVSLLVQFPGTSGISLAGEQLLCAALTTTGRAHTLQ